VARKGEGRGVYREKDCLGDPGADGRMILRRIFMK
jgi:hypothetical protein